MASKIRRFRLPDKEWEQFCQQTNKPADTLRELILNYLKEKER